MNLPKSKTTDDFYNWLDKQDLAPYKVMFEDVPEMVQIPYIQKYLREQACTEICIRPISNLLRYYAEIWIHDKFVGIETLETFTSYESANRQATIDAFKYLTQSEL